MHAAEQVLTALRDRGTQRDWLDQMQSRAELYEVLDYRDWERRDREYDEDWARLWWVKLRGTARVFERHERAAELLQAKYEQYRSEPPAGPFVVVDIERRVHWAAS